MRRSTFALLLVTVFAGLPAAWASIGGRLQGSQPPAPASADSSQSIANSTANPNGQVFHVTSGTVDSTLTAATVRMGTGLVFPDGTTQITAPVAGGGASGISTMTVFLGDFGSVYLATSIAQAVDSFPNMGTSTVTFKVVGPYAKVTSTDIAIPLIYSLNRSTEIGATNVAFTEVFRATLTANVKTSTPAVLGAASEIILYPQQTLHLFYNQIPAGTLPGGKHGVYLEYFTWQKN